MRLRSLASAAAVLVTASSAYADDAGKFQKPPVACLWQVYLSLENVGRVCFQNKDATTQDKLKKIVALSVQYMTSREGISEQYFVGLTRKMLDGLSKDRDGLCAHGPGRITSTYEMIRTSNMDEIIGKLNELLASPQPPQALAGSSVCL